MNRELIMQTETLDLIFENRNKLYGAYDLRKFYKQRMFRSLELMLGGVLALSAFTFLPGKKVTNYSTVDYIIPPVSKMPKKEEKSHKQIRENKHPAAAQKKVAGSTTITNKKTDTLVVIQMTDVISNKNTTGPVDLDPGLSSIPNTVNGSNLATSVILPVINKNQPMELDKTDIPPSFPGGLEAFYRFMRKNLNNPKEMESGEEVTVQVKFVVGKQGKLESFQIIKDGGNDFNNEVLRVMKKMPQWIPGKYKGENVSVYYIIPVRFVPTD